jgi:hypothetical protein
MTNSNLMKTFISLYFHVDTKTQLNHFSYISKEANFEVLYITNDSLLLRPNDICDGLYEPLVIGLNVVVNASKVFGNTTLRKYE